MSSRLASLLARPLAVLLVAATCLADGDAAEPDEAGAAAPALARDWCTGVSPVSWGFTIAPPAGVRELRLRPRSPGVSLVDARGGPGLPEGWTVTLQAGDAIATGPAPLPTGSALASALIVGTDRASAEITPRGVLPVTWDLRFAAEPGGAALGEPTTASFPPVMELADAVSRGLVLATAEPLSPNGPVEVTVDNPTWHPLWLDLPPGTLVQAGGADWVACMVRPFRMMRKQKTGVTLGIFPVGPPGSAKPPRKLGLTGRAHAESEAIAEIGLAVHELQERARSRARRPGNFEAIAPFDFWPMAVRWALWEEVGDPPAQELRELIAGLRDERSAAGDAMAASIDPEAAATEVEALLLELATVRASLRARALPIDLQAARARFH